ncbi:hypothetical protein [Evansella tamaricis]|uniref:Uncharacterized protein n=1 Tax=Evansella tamaricis TaxID=2069301 RepID=A0ABS6JKG0_9BACI|nr:hypothetical protein [Evansella tamaricis]MBU9713302.1 hypothetical protein [Evansella tamaricis]
MTSEIHLFILWEKSHSKWDEIVKDITGKFSIIQFVKVHWTPRHFSRNLARFYGLDIPRISQKEEQCGNGPFLLLIVEDANPIYVERQTTKGKTLVNSNMYDAKQKYRMWTGGGYRIHGTNTEEESKHDLALLCNKDISEFYGEKWSGQITEMEKNLIGLDGFESMEQLFTLLNRTVNYVVLRNFEELPDRYTSTSHGDIDLLTDDLKKVVRLTNGEKVFNPSYRVHYKIVIGGEDVYFDFRFVGDRYMDRVWERDIMKSRFLHGKGVYIPERESHFYSLLYHVLVHKRRIKSHYKKVLIELSRELNIGLKERDFSDPFILKSYLDGYMKEKEYHYTRPFDRSVFFNKSLIKKEFK